MTNLKNTGTVSVPLEQHDGKGRVHYFGKYGKLVCFWEWDEKINLELMSVLNWSQHKDWR